MNLRQTFSKTEIKSPDYLGHKPNANANDGVVRIGRKPLICVGLGLSIVAGVMTYTLVMKSIVAQSLNEEDGKQNDSLTNVIPLLEKKPRDGIIGGSRSIVLNKAKENNILLVPPPPPGDITNARDPYADAEFQMWQQREQEKLQLEQAKRAELKHALNAETTTYTDNQASINHQPLLYGSVKEETNFLQPQRTTVNIPKETDAGYVLHTRVQPVSPFELKAGTVIPSVMLGGINSDLPGQIMAQVSQNVYDTATGRYLLIPQGSKLVGNYDHQVALGHKRVFVVWHRLIYPDASTVNLENMNGADQSGYAGFGDKTNTHFWTAFRSAIMLSAITAGVQLSQPQALTSNGGYSSQQMIAAAMGMQMNNLGQQSLMRNLNQPPTIEIRPGYVFNVLINKDMILPVWQPEHLAYGSDE